LLFILEKIFPIYKYKIIFIRKGRLLIQKILKSKDVKEYLGISSDKTLYKLLNTKGFPQFKIGREYYIPEEDFLNWISKNAKMNTKIII